MHVHSERDALLSDIYFTPVKTQPCPSFSALLSFLSKKKARVLVYGRDINAIFFLVLIKKSRLARLLFFIKGFYLDFDTKKLNRLIIQDYQIVFMPRSFVLKRSGNCNIALRVMHSQPENLS